MRQEVSDAVRIPRYTRNGVEVLEDLGEKGLTLEVIRGRLLPEELKKSDRMVDMSKQKPASFAGFKPHKLMGKCRRYQKEGHMAKDFRVKLQGEANVAAAYEGVALMVGRVLIQRWNGQLMH